MGSLVYCPLLCAFLILSSRDFSVLIALILNKDLNIKGDMFDW